MQLKLSMLRQIIKSLYERGYVKTSFGTYTKVFRFSDVPDLELRKSVSLLDLALYRGDYNELLDKIYVDSMDALAAEETKQRLR